MKEFVDVSKAKKKLAEIGESYGCESRTYDVEEAIEFLESSLQTAQAWLERWAVHVGNCKGGDYCTCGLTNARFEASNALIHLKGEAVDG